MTTIVTTNITKEIVFSNGETVPLTNRIGIKKEEVNGT